MNLDDNMPYKELLQGIEEESTIPKCYIKLIAPTVGLIKVGNLPQGELTPINEVFPEIARYKVTLLGPPQDKLNQMHDAEAARAKELVKMNQRIRNMRRLARTPVRTATSASSSKYTFDRVEPLPGLPNPERSRQFLNKLKEDLGVRALMEKYRWNVPLLTELGPNEPNNLLGRNTGAGAMIELRIRTDDYDGWRSYADVVRVLCHELAHNEVQDHNRQFWDLTHKLEREVIELNPFGRAGRQLVGEMYRPEEAPMCDEGGWFGSTQKLGTAFSSTSVASGSAAGGSSTAVVDGQSTSSPPDDDSLKAKIRRAAEDRQRPSDN